MGADHLLVRTPDGAQSTRRKSMLENRIVERVDALQAVRIILGFPRQIGDEGVVVKRDN